MVCFQGSHRQLHNYVLRDKNNLIGCGEIGHGTRWLQLALSDSDVSTAPHLWLIVIPLPSAHLFSISYRISLPAMMTPMRYVVLVLGLIVRCASLHRTHFNVPDCP